ncbi:MAG: hypothetical protein E5X74_29020 [Mesorhizobium sp.]|nr:MAG: hypothetical protein EOR75_23335 [Mesorhizobium sp.]TIO74020.1 MAG: hypothetical protein E5X75_25985 [Mesorhizobium sp.]TIO81395.1 MAG: hypothetical protein E5X74_29020 [Mesorhizobium sp.]
MIVVSRQAEGAVDHVKASGQLPGVCKASVAQHVGKPESLEAPLGDVCSLPTQLEEDADDREHAADRSVDCHGLLRIAGGQMRRVRQTWFRRRNEPQRMGDLMFQPLPHFRRSGSDLFGA